MSTTTTTAAATSRVTQVAVTPATGATMAAANTADCKLQRVLIWTIRIASL